MSDLTFASDIARIGRFRVRFVMRAAKFDAEWTPNVPAPEELSHAQFARYRRLRNEFIASFAAATGLRVAVVEL